MNDGLISSSTIPKDAFSLLNDVIELQTKLNEKEEELQVQKEKVANILKSHLNTVRI